MYKLQRRNRFNLFDDWFDGFFKTGTTNTLLKTDIKEVDDHYEIIMDVPGLEKENINITLENGYLAVNVSKTIEEKTEDQYYLRKERHSQSATRKFYVGDAIAEEDIKASLDKGVLVLEVPKETEKVITKKTIEIN